MKFFPFKLLLALVFSFLISPIWAQNSHMDGYWMASGDNFPLLFIQQNAAGLRVKARGGFLENELEAIRFQQSTAASGTKLQVVFPSLSEEIILNVRMIGKTLQAAWDCPSVSDNILYTTYTHTKREDKKELNRGTISGQAVGKAKSIASIFHVSLYGPDDSQSFLCTQSLGREGGFNFSSLPDGEYWMYVEARGPTIVKAFPAKQKVLIKNGNASLINIELR